MGLWLFPIAVALFFAADHYNFRDVYDRTLLSAASGEDVSIHLWAFGAFVVMYALRFFETNITFIVAEAKDFWVQALLVAIGGTVELIVKTLQSLSHQSPKFASRVEEFCDSLGEPGCTCDFYMWEGETLVDQPWVATAYNGALAFWAIITTCFQFAFEDVDRVWTSVFGNVLSAPGFVHLWSTQGQSGTAHSRLACAGLHLGDLFILLAGLRFLMVLIDSVLEIVAATFTDTATLLFTRAGEDAEASYRERRKRQRQLTTRVRKMLMMNNPEEERTFYSSARV